MVIRVLLTWLLLLLLPVAGLPQTPIETHLKQAQAYIEAKQPDLAARELSAILAIDPNHLEARTNLGVVYYFQGDYAKAAPQLRSALKLRPTLWNIQALLGMCEKRLGQAAAAQTDLEKAFAQLQEEKLRVQAGLELLELCYGVGDLTKAAQVAGALRQIRPMDPDVLYAAHRIYADLAGETTLSLAMTAPKSARMRQVMGQELARQGNLEEAIAQYREALKLEPNAPGLHFELAELLNGGTGENQAEAETEYKAALKDNPFDARSECRLGEIAFRAGDWKNAFARYSRAVALQPNDADANLGLGKTLSAMHEPAKALPYLERSARAEPFDAVIHYRLGAVYRELGRTADSERELAEFQKMKDMKERLKQLYQEMRIRPGREQRTDPDIPK